MDRPDGFRELDRHECLRLLAQVPIGRIVYTRRALPAVFPVNFSLDHDFAVLVRTSATAGVADAVDGVVVAFEADQFDEAQRSGWSVVVMGQATLVSDPDEQARLRRTGPRAWIATPDEVFFRIDAELVTGRLLPSGGAMTEAEQPARATVVAPIGVGQSRDADEP